MVSPALAKVPVIYAASTSSSSSIKIIIYVGAQALALNQALAEAQDGFSGLHCLAFLFQEGKALAFHAHGVHAHMDQDLLSGDALDAHGVLVVLRGVGNGSVAGAMNM